MLTSDELREAKELLVNELKRPLGTYFDKESFLLRCFSYYPKLISHIEAQNKIIEVIREGLQDISFYTSCQACECNAEIKSKALEQADKIANGRED